MSNPAKATEKGAAKNSSSQIIHAFDRSGAEQIRISLNVFRGTRYVDLRIFFRTVDGDYQPTKKGLTLNPSFLPELEKAVKKLSNELDGAKSKN